MWVGANEKREPRAVRDRVWPLHAADQGPDILRLGSRLKVDNKVNWAEANNASLRTLDSRMRIGSVSSLIWSARVPPSS